MRLFVYGTLKTGYPLNQHTLGSNPNSKKISDGTIHGFEMYSNGFYPYIVKVPTSQKLEDNTKTVKGEVWEVNDSILMTELRSIEREYDETPVMVTTDGGQEECIAYVYNGEIRASWNKIESGVFSR